MIKLIIMQIIWHGQSCFQIFVRREKNNQVSIVIDPFDESLGLRVPKLEADILLITHSHHDHNNIKAVSGPTSASSPFLISGPGEYEVKEVYIRGIPSLGENTIYTIKAEDLKLCHLGDLDQKELTADQLEKIGEVDILMIPVGGIYTISSKEAPKIMAQIEPKIIIPMHYQVPKLKIHPVKSREAGAKQFNGVKLDGLDKFLKTMGIKSIESLPKLSIKKKDLSEEEIKIIVLKP